MSDQEIDSPPRGNPTQTHTLRIDIPLDLCTAATLAGDNPVSAPLDAVIALVRLAYPTTVCGDIMLTLTDIQTF